jgi:uncharacterized protein
MKIVIAGGSGQLGNALVHQFKAKNHTVTVLSRNPEYLKNPADVTMKKWDGKTPGDWCSAMEGADVIINLSGASIGEGRWTDRRKAVLLESRIQSTKILIHAVASMSSLPHTFINASAVGFYGHTDDTIVYENSPRGKGYLSDLCFQWEKEALKVKEFISRVIMLRMGVVLEKNKGALKRMVLPFRFFAGGYLGSGSQWISWIHINDLVNAIIFILRTKGLDGPINLTSPNPLPMKFFAQELGKILHRPSWLPVPPFVLKIVLGEMSTMVLDGQRVLPRKLLTSGFDFQYPTIDRALAEIFSRKSNTIRM